MMDSDREARLEEIRGWMEKSDCPCGECDVTRFLLSEIDRLKAKLEGEDEQD